MSHGHHHHEHSHYHIHTKERSTRIVVGISICTMLVLLYAGYVTNSKTLLMEGWHMLSHVLVLMLAWFAYLYIRIRKNEISHELEHRIISLCGFASAVIMLSITGFMIYEAIEKFFVHDVDATNEAILVAVIAIFVNGLSAYFLHREEEKSDLNLQAAYIHVMSDVVLSVFAVIALVAIRLFDLRILDSVFALLGSLIILKWSADLIRKSWREVLFNRS